MLQSNLLHTDRTRLPLSGQAQSDLIEGGGIGDLIKFGMAFLRRQYLMIIVTAVLATASSLLYLRLAQPTYIAQVQVLLGNPRAQFVQQQSLLAEPAFDLNQIETQLQLLKSRATAVTVINQLNLAEDPEFFNESGYSLLSLWQPLWQR